VFPPALAAALRERLAEAGKIPTPWYVQRRIKTAAEDLEWGIAQSAHRSMDLPTALANGKELPFAGGARAPS